jgi:hypothetical protein
MKKILPYLFIALISVAAYFMVRGMLKVFKQPSAQQKKLAQQQVDEYKIHNKAIGQLFFVDSIGYKFIDFNYFEQKDSVRLKINLIINNISNIPKKYEPVFFSLTSNDNGNYLPLINTFTVAAHQTQNLQLIYQLAVSKLPYILCKLKIISSTDTLQNGVLSFSKNYKAQG